MNQRRTEYAGMALVYRIFGLLHRAHALGAAPIGRADLNVWIVRRRGSTQRFGYGWDAVTLDFKIRCFDR